MSVPLKMEVGVIDQMPRARMPTRLPVVLSRDEVSRVLKALSGVMWVVGMLLHCAGLRLQECLDLRVKDIDFDLNELLVRRGKGQKDRRTMLPGIVREALRRHLADVKTQHEHDLVDGVGRVVLPFALDRKSQRVNGVGVGVCVSRRADLPRPRVGPAV